MPVFNYPKKEVNVKVVYYGPGLSGKTTNLQQIHDGIKPDHRGKLVSLATQTDRTLFFDFMPLELGSLGGYKIRLHLYTVPGQVHYNATRKLVLKGVDGVVLVADSQKAMTDANLESVLNLEKNLQSYGKSLADLPHVIQANKRDLDEVISMEEINSMLNHHGGIVTEAVASEGTGVMETLTEIVRMVMRGLRDQFVTESPEPALEPESSFAKASTVAQGTMADKSVNKPAPESTVASAAAEASPSAKATGDLTVDKPAPQSPVKVQVPVEGLGTLELTVNVSAKLLEKGEAVTVEVNVTGAALAGNLPEPEREPLVAQEVPVEPPPVEKELPLLEEAPAEPLGAPLDGQAPDDFHIPDLPQEEKILLEEDLNTAEPGPSSPEPASGYDPTVQPLEFDFPDTEPEEEPKKKGLFGRFKKK